MTTSRQTTTNPTEHGATLVVGPPRTARLLWTKLQSDNTKACGVVSSHYPPFEKEKAGNIGIRLLMVVSRDFVTLNKLVEPYLLDWCLGRLTMITHPYVGF